MIKNYSSKDLIRSEYFVSDPVCLVGKEIQESSEKKIILNGCSGGGRSIVLTSHEKRNIATRSQAIYTSFDSFNSFSREECFNNKFLAHYYELMLSKKMLNYIHEHYDTYFERDFVSIDTFLSEIVYDTDNYIRECYCEEPILERYLSTLEIMGDIVKKFKSVYGVDCLTLMIDKFDFINNRGEFVQNLLSQYFDLFDKSVIVVDDEALKEEDSIVRLSNHGYSVMSVDYGRDIDIVKEIVRLRVDKYNNNCVLKGYKPFPIDKVTDEIYSQMVDSTNGNIKLMFDIFDEVNSSWQWTEGNLQLEESFKKGTDAQLSKTKMMSKINTRAKFYL